jgi:hypothetical protein
MEHPHLKARLGCVWLLTKRSPRFIGLLVECNWLHGLARNEAPSPSYSRSPPVENKSILTFPCQAAMEIYIYNNGCSDFIDLRHRIRHPLVSGTSKGEAHKSTSLVCPLRLHHYLFAIVCSSGRSPSSMVVSTYNPLPSPTIISLAH